MKREYFITILIILASIVSLYIVYNDNKISMPSIATSSIEDILTSNNLGEYINNYTNLDDNYLILGNNYNKIFDIKNRAVITYLDLFKDKEVFYKLIQDNLLSKYPKFVVNNLNIKEFTKLEIHNQYIELHFNKEHVSPSIEEDVYIRLICKDYKDNYKIECDDSISENPNVYTIDPNKKSVALTFDDGPCKLTYDVINKLKDNHMSATFFELGYMMINYPDAVKAVRNAGFEIGSHGYNHYSFVKMKVNRTNEELNKTKEVYRNITGEELYLTRPPYGAYNTSIKEGVDTIFIRWNVDSLDWKEKDKFVDNVMNTVDDGAIILLHDIHKTTIDGLDTLLPLLYSQGYQVMGISELAKVKNITLENHNVYYKLISE